MTDQDARALGERLDSLLEQLQETAEPAVRERVEDLVGAIVGLYGAGLERMVGLLREQDGGEQRLGELAADDLVANLLILHDLHPEDVDARVQRALDGVRPYLGSHAGGVEYLGIDTDGVVRLRLEGSCDGCPSSAVTVKLAIERAVLEHVPEAVSVAVEGMAEEGDGQPLLQIPPFRPHGEVTGETDAEPGWRHLELDLVDGALTTVDVAGATVLVCNVAGTWYAYRDACARCDGTLSTGRLDEDVLSCAGCGARYQVCLAGRGVPDESVALQALPLLPDDAGWQLAVPAPVGV